MALHIIIAETDASVAITGGTAQLVTFSTTGNDEWTAASAKAITKLKKGEICRVLGATSVKVTQGTARIITDPQKPPVPPFQFKSGNTDASFKAFQQGKASFP